MQSARVVVLPHDLTLIVDPAGDGVIGAGEGGIQECEDTGGIEKPMPSARIAVDPHDLAPIIDTKGLGPRGGARDINGDVHITVLEKAMAPCGITELPHNLARRINPKGRGECSAGDIERGEDI